KLESLPTYRTINDYGALTPKMTGVME
ncbi:hypothetical protein, partial [Escherichia coli]